MVPSMGRIGAVTGRATWPGESGRAATGSAARSAPAGKIFVRSGGFGFSPGTNGSIRRSHAARMSRKTVVKASYGLYYDLLLLGEYVSFNNAAGVSEMDLLWSDANNDLIVQESENDRKFHAAWSKRGVPRVFG